MSDEKIFLNNANLDMVQGGKNVSHNLDGLGGLDGIKRGRTETTSNKTGISDNMQKEIEKLEELSKQSATTNPNAEVILP